MAHRKGIGRNSGKNIDQKNYGLSDIKMVWTFRENGRRKMAQNIFQWTANGKRKRGRPPLKWKHTLNLYGSYNRGFKGEQSEMPAPDGNLWGRHKYLILILIFENL